jgi:hypothetical protein
MKKIIALLSVVIMLSLSSFAVAATCVCIGMGNYLSDCGNGIGGRSFDVKTGVTDSNVKDWFLKDTTANAVYDSNGKAYSSSSGWLCFK